MYILLSLKKNLELSFSCRIQEDIVEGLPVVDVDGWYLYRKQQILLSTGATPLPPTDHPLVGWELVTDSDVDSLATLILLVYSYCAD